MSNRITPDNITSLGPKEIFVFGSNKEGRHDGGAARFATDNFGAIYGQGQGLQGQSYAIDSMSGLDVLRTEVEAFIAFAKLHPDLTFLVTPIGCGIAGHTPEEVAPLFESGRFLNNIHFPRSFWDSFGPIKSHKVTHSDMTCRPDQRKPFQYEIGVNYIHNGPVKLCGEGFHSCLQPQHCFNYYSFDRQNRVFEVEISGVIDCGEDKIASEKIRFIREIPWEEVLLLVNTGVANTGHSNTGDRNTGNSNTGDRNTGDWNTGNSNTGDRNTGDWNTGDRNTGYRNTGDRNTGNSNTGDRNTGYRNTGDRNTGDRNTGDWNTGDWNTGDRNTGNSNTGDRNTGDWNTGYRNTGYSNTGNRNTGLFCTEDALFPIFDEPSDWTEEQFLQSKVYSLLCQVETKQWVPEHLMSDEEKKANKGWKTAEGFVRDTPFKQAFQDKWHNWDKESRQAFLDLPNFDAAKFEHITGVSVTPDKTTVDR